MARLPALLGLLVVALAAWRIEAALAERWPPERHGTDHAVAGRIASLPEREGATWRFEFAPLDPALPRRIRVAWYRADQAPRGAECWRFTLRVRSVHGALNPGGFDYEGWLFRRGIGATATVREAARCAEPVHDPVLAVRQGLVDAIRAALAGHAATALVVALAVGDSSGLAGADWDALRLTGTTHLIAISGFNIAIVAGVAWFLGRWSWALWPRLCLALPAQRAGLVCAAVAAGGYALLAGFEPPVQRAVLMLWIVLAALWSHRPARPARVLAVALGAVLLLDPLAVLSPGLWLSFGAVAAIFYVSLGRLRAPGSWHALVWLQLLLAIALAPLSLFFFSGASGVAPLVNLLAVPFFTVLTPWVLGAVLALPLSARVGEPLLRLAADALELFREALGAIASGPDFWIAASPPGPLLALAVPGIALLFAPRGVPLRLLGAACLLPLFAIPPTPPRGGFEVSVLDVGQGLAVVVRTARHTLLYDAGPAFEDGFDAGASIVAPFLLRQGVRDVDTLVVSHGDNDHAGGAAAVRRLLRVRREIGGDGEPCRAGTQWEWDGVRFALLHPDAASWRDNDGSCVLRVQGPFSVLLPGDVEAEAEAHLAGPSLRADVLVAPHHGSRTSSTPAFVAAVRPEVVVYSAGWRNPFRHPRPEVVARYAALGARQFVTGASGALVLSPTGDGIDVRAHRREAARFWNAPPGP